MKPERSQLKQTQRVVVKIGTSVCINDKGQPNGPLLLQIAQQIAQLQERCDVVLVSSGAVGMGLTTLNGWDQAHCLGNKQALAAIGQLELMALYKNIFSLLNRKVAQVLLTRMDLGARAHYLNARNTFYHLLKHKILPIVNENDSVATEEFQLGDNDILSVLVASVCDADLIVNLTQTEGLLNEQKQRVSVVPKITQEVCSWVSSERSKGGTGGMMSKLDAVQTAHKMGLPMVIARAQTPNILLKLLEGEDLGTYFPSPIQPATSKRKWLISSTSCKGKVYLDEGARQALTSQGKSLLPVGVTKIEGNFDCGDIISILDSKNQELGRGLSNYSHRDLELIKGKKSDRFEELLGYRNYHQEVIHRNNLYLT